MLYFIERAVVWLRRACYSRGFGVQSPWAYRFIRYVVNEHYPYYKYEQLDEQVNGIGKRTRKLCKLYFRLANYQQPHSFVDCCPNSSCYELYVKAGCIKTHYHKVTEEMLQDAYIRLFSEIGEYSMVRFSICKDTMPLIKRSLDLLPASSVLVIENIKCDKEAEKYWSELISDSRTGISFDLYYCGIIFLNKEMVKQDYIVNF